MLLDAPGVGMNAMELERNPVLTSFDVHDLNTDPKLPYDRQLVRCHHERCVRGLLNKAAGGVP